MKQFLKVLPDLSWQMQISFYILGSIAILSAALTVYFFVKAMKAKRKR